MEEYQQLLSIINKTIIDKSPLGSAAIAGTTVKIDRNRIAEKLGIKKIVINSLAATGSRNFLTITTSILTCIYTTLSRIAEDLIIWSTQQFNYVELPKSHLATSSIMPHKKNPATMEIMRAKAGEAIGELTTILTIIKGLPSGYDLDLQETTKHTWKIIKDLKITLKILNHAMEHIKININKMRRDVENYPTIAAELAEIISTAYKIPHRKAHQIVAETIRETNDIAEVIDKISKKIEYKINIPGIIQEYLKMKNTIGSPNPKEIKKIIKNKLKKLKEVDTNN